MSKISIISIILFFIFIGGQVLAQSPQKIEKEWTVLIFLNGNNNLNRFGRDNLLDMEKVGSNDQLNIVTQWADFEYKKTRRLYITKSKDPTQITSPVIVDMGANVDMGDVKTLNDFIKWGIEHYPAKHFFIIVWDHGTGWHAKKLTTEKDISHDIFTKNSITTKQLAESLKMAAEIIGRKVDIYGSDACQMAMIEIATEMADSVDYYIGSEQDIPAEGWPYSKVLTQWQSLKDRSPVSIASIVHSEYIKFYRELNHRRKQATLSVFDLSATDKMLAAIKDFGHELKKIKGSDIALANNARSDTQLFTTDYLDLIDFANHIASANLTQFDPRVVETLLAAKDSYVVKNGSTAAYEGKAFGISIWLPGLLRWYKQYLALYKTLRFSQSTGWEESIRPLQKEK